MAATETSNFFKKERSIAEVRVELLSQFFTIWCNAVLANQHKEAVKKALYIDLAAEVKLAEPETPAAFIKVLDTIFRSSGKSIDLNKAISTFYYHPEPGIADELKAAILTRPFYEELINKPAALQDAANYEQLHEELTNNTPALAFLNPFSDVFAQDFLLSLVKEWRTDLVMYFDFESMNAAVKSSKVSSQLQELLGEHLPRIKAYYKAVRDAAKRETFVLAKFKAVFEESQYSVFLFKINNPNKIQLNQYLMLATKTDIVYTRVKELMLKYTEFQEDGVPLFGVNLKQQQMGLFQEHYTYSIVNLINSLAQKANLYSNKTLQSIYEADNTGTNYSRENYSTAYQKLKEQGKVSFVNPKTGQPISSVTYTSIIRYKK